MIENLMPQTYPLWLAEMEAGSEQFLHGRIIGWQPAPDPDIALRELIPVVAFVNDRGETVVVRPAVADSVWFLGDNAGKVVGAASDAASGAGLHR